MKLIILDSGLTDNSGHNFLFARLVAEEARRRGIDVVALCHCALQEGVEYPFDALRIFDTSYYYIYDGDDPVQSPATSAFVLNSDFREAMRRLPDDFLAKEDIVWVPTINQNNLRGLALWLQELGAEITPTVAVTFVLPAGISTAGVTVQVHDSLRALQYRAALQSLSGLQRVHLLATGHQTASDYAYLAKGHVAPQPLLVDIPRTMPDPERRTALLFAGNSAQRKGIELLPEVVRLLAERMPDWTFLVQANDTTGGVLKEPVAALRAMAMRVPQLELQTGYVNESEYRRLFERAAIVVIPYDVDAYRTMSSGILWEAIAAGRPIVLPRKTYLEREAAAWNASFAAIDTGTAQAIADGLVAAIEKGKLCSEAAIHAAADFHGRNGAARFLDQLLSFRSREAPA